MEAAKFILQIEGLEGGEASRQAQAMEKLLLDECQSVDVRRIQLNPGNLSGGVALIVAIAGSPALAEFVRALRLFGQLYFSSEVTISAPGGTVILRGQSASKAASILEEREKLSGSKQVR